MGNVVSRLSSQVFFSSHLVDLLHAQELVELHRFLRVLDPQHSMVEPEGSISPMSSPCPIGDGLLVLVRVRHLADCRVVPRS